MQSCLEQTLLCAGENTYKVPHLGKDRAARAGTAIDRCLQCSEEAWAAGNAALQAGQAQGGQAQGGQAQGGSA